MDALLVGGVAATFTFTIWAHFERDNPKYFQLELSQNLRNVINIVTVVALYAGFALMLAARGSWGRNILLTIIWYIVGCRVLATLLYRSIRVKMSRWFESWKRCLYCDEIMPQTADTCEHCGRAYWTPRKPAD